MNALVEEVYGYPALAKDPAEPMSRTIKRKIEDEVDEKDKELTDILPRETESVLKPSDDSLMTRAVLAAITNKKQGKRFFAARAGNDRRRSLLSHLSPFQSTRLRTLRQKTTLDLNRLIMTMNLGNVSKVISVFFKPFTG